MFTELGVLRRTWLPLCQSRFLCQSPSLSDASRCANAESSGLTIGAGGAGEDASAGSCPELPIINPKRHQAELRPGRNRTECPMLLQRGLPSRFRRRPGLQCSTAGWLQRRGLTHPSVSLTLSLGRGWVRLEPNGHWRPVWHPKSSVWIQAVFLPGQNSMSLPRAGEGSRLTLFWKLAGT